MFKIKDSEFQKSRRMRGQLSGQGWNLRDYFTRADATDVHRAGAVIYDDEMLSKTRELDALDWRYRQQR